MEQEQVEAALGERICTGLLMTVQQNVKKEVKQKKKEAKKKLKEEKKLKKTK